MATLVCVCFAEIVINAAGRDRLTVQPGDLTVIGAGFISFIYALFTLLALLVITLFQSRRSRQKQIAEYMARGNAYRAQERYSAAAINAYKHVTRLNPDTIKAHRNSAEIYNSLKRYPEAILSYKKMLEADESNYRLHNHIGDLYEKLNQFDEAVQSYKNAIQLNPESVVAHGGLGQAYQRMGRTK